MFDIASLETPTAAGTFVLNLGNQDGVPVPLTFHFVRPDTPTLLDLEIATDELQEKINEFSDALQQRRDELTEAIVRGISEQEDIPLVPSRGVYDRLVSGDDTALASLTELPAEQKKAYLETPPDKREFAARVLLAGTYAQDSLARVKLHIPGTVIQPVYDFLIAHIVRVDGMTRGQAALTWGDLSSAVRYALLRKATLEEIISAQKTISDSVKLKAEVKNG